MRYATIHVGEALEVLATLPDKSVQCVVTSPPYWGLRDYGVDEQIGLEETFGEFLDRLVAVFREVRRVLRDDGTCWVNIGDSYSSSKGGDPYSGFNSRYHGSGGGKQDEVKGAFPAGQCKSPLPKKNLLGQPWRLAFALQDDGWILRSDIIWSKTNSMPESIKDRPSKSHEYIFLLTKAPRYFYDAEAVREPVTGNAHPRGNGVNPKAAPLERGSGVRANASWSAAFRDVQHTARNARTVWTIATQPCAEAHFATFPLELPARCIRAGTSAHGCCPECGTPWIRIVEKGAPDERRRRACGADASGGYEGKARKDYAPARAQDPSATKARILAGMRERVTTGWAPACECEDSAVVPCTVLDPFSGAGTTGLAALRLGRAYIGIELNPEFAEMSRRRIQEDAPLFNHVEVER